MKREDKLLKDVKLIEKQFPDYCLVKKIVEERLVPSHFVFTYYTNVQLVHLKALLNEDDKTYQVSSSDQVLIKSVEVDKIRDVLDSMKIQMGLTGAIHTEYKITSFER
jgi:hypothetical protein